jgi:hypothetical protein
VNFVVNEEGQDLQEEGKLPKNRCPKMIPLPYERPLKISSSAHLRGSLTSSTRESVPRFLALAIQTSFKRNPATDKLI